jgi:O-antigen/teichoic acid export membrane protein
MRTVEPLLFASLPAESPRQIAGPLQPSLSVLRFSRWTLWVTTGSLAVIDQGLISGSNFLIGILLARWLSPEQYGAYALAFAIFLLISFVHQALLLEPQKVLGASIYREHPQQYLGVLMWVQAAAGLLIFIVLGVLAWATREVMHSRILPAALVGVALAAPCILLFWLLRSALYVRQAPQTAAIGASFYCALLLLGFLLLRQYSLLSPFTTFVVMGLGALVISAFILMRLKPALRLTTGTLTLRQVARSHWEYGRWVLASLVIGWASGDIYYPLVTGLYGTVAAGSLKALFNLTLPLAQTCNALSQLLLPYGAHEHARDGRCDMGRLALRITLLFASGAVAYWLAIVLFDRPLFSVLYAGKYREVLYLIPSVALGSVFANALYGPLTALRAMRSPSLVLVASCAGAIGLVLGFPATRMFGLRGAVWGWVLSTALSFFCASLMLRFRCRAAIERT